MCICLNKLNTLTSKWVKFSGVKKRPRMVCDLRLTAARSIFLFTEQPFFSFVDFNIYVCDNSQEDGSRYSTFRMKSTVQFMVVHLHDDDCAKFPLYWRLQWTFSAERSVGFETRDYNYGMETIQKRLFAYAKLR